MIKVISFDLDGTLIDKNFDILFWEVEIPKLYSEQHKIPIKEAEKIVKKAYDYDNLHKKNHEWYLIQPWFKTFELKKDYKKIIKDLQKEIKLYPDVIENLKKLSQNYKLIIISNSAKEFIKLKLEVEDLKKYFNKIFSAVSDLKLVKKDSKIYKTILKKLKIKPEEVVHVGDDYKFDYLTPKSIGIMAFYLDRREKKKGKHIIHDLKELVQKINNL